MKKLLVICGPTGTGKTKLAFQLAKKFNGEVVSADSRQVYRLMNIGTGKDIPKGFEFRNSNLGFKGGEVGFYTDGDTRIWGYDLVGPTQEFSVAQYVEIAGKIIEDIWQPRQKLTHSGGQGGKLPILVGGTGLYIKAVVDGIPTAKIPKNQNLRKSLGDKDASELFEILAQVDPLKAGSMNSSDRKNPRRLVRAIEIASFRWKMKGSPASHFAHPTSVLLIGLTAPKKYLDKKIEERVDARIRQGIEKEIESLFVKGVTWGHQSMQALGYRQMAPYSSYLTPESSSLALARSESTGQAIKMRVIKDWKQVEKQYVKRQMTWFKRDKRIKWFDISKLGWEKGVERLVKKWYKTE